MKKLNLNNLYESSLPPTRTDVLWADKDENTGDLKAIHRFKKGQWEPYMVSVGYLEGSDTDTYTVRFFVPTEHTSKDNWDTMGGLKETLSEFMTSHGMNANTLLTNPNQMKIVSEDVPKSIVTQLLYDMHDGSLLGCSVVSSCFSISKNS